MDGTFINLVDKCLGEMAEHWQSFKKDQGKLICHWLVDNSDAWLFDQFLYSGIFGINDLFVPLRTSAQRPESYIYQLATEFMTHVRTKKYTSENLTDLLAKGLHDTDLIVTEFIPFIRKIAKNISDTGNGYLVLCLTPESGPELIAINRFILFITGQQLAANINILIPDDLNQPRLNKLAGYFPGKTQTRIIKPDYYQLIAPPSTIDRENSSEIQFNRIYADFAKAVTAESLFRIESLADQCLTICLQESWENLAISIQLAVAYAYTQHKKTEEALRLYLTIIDRLEKAFATGDNTAGKLSISAWLCLGPVYWKLKDQPAAIAAYHHALTRAEALQEWLYAANACKSLLWVYRKSGQSRSEEEAYQCYFTIAGKLSATDQQSVQLNQIAAEYIQKQPTFRYRQLAEVRLKQLLGPYWQMGEVSG